jgi:hypothetical protein
MFKTLCSTLVVLGVLSGLSGCLSRTPVGDTPPEHQACADKVCGEPCSQCVPGDPECLEIGVFTVCSETGECVVKTDDVPDCDPNRCEPGTQIPDGDGCNTCECPPSGRRDERTSCTEADCGPMTCTPGANFDAQDGCNVCLCPESGVRAAAVCTERVCTALCTPGDTFMIDCKACVCPASGLRAEAACDERDCGRVCDGVACGTPCGSAQADQASGDPAEVGTRPAPSLLCDANGACVEAYEEELDCPQPCDGLACGATCVPARRGQQSGGQDEAPGSGAERPAQFACNVNGICVQSTDLNLACGSGDRCEPGVRFRSTDGCSVCVCPGNGIVSRAACDASACTRCRNNGDCADDTWCDFDEDICELESDLGRCVRRPDPVDCPPGGSGVCGCDGQTYVNACERQQSGVDGQRFGGCAQLAGDGTHACGDQSCDPSASFCLIRLDVSAEPPAEPSLSPLYYCTEPPPTCEGQERIDCECLNRGVADGRLAWDHSARPILCSDTGGLALGYDPAL